MIAIYWAQPRAEHGLTATYFTDSAFNSFSTERVEQVALVNSNDKLITPTQPFSIRWRGFLRLQKHRNVSFVIPPRVDSRLLVNGKTIYESRADVIDPVLTPVQTLTAGSHAITFEVSRPEHSYGYFSANFAWTTPAGIRLIPSSNLYPTSITDSQARSETRRSDIRIFCFGIASLAAASLTLLTLWPKLHHASPRQLWPMLLILGLALYIRYSYLHDLVTQLPDFDAFPIGSDHRTYEAHARDFIRGHWPKQSGFYRQPGFSWLLGNYHTLFGPDLRLYQILQLAGGALATIPLYAIGKRIFSARVGMVAAIIWATLPLAIFYNTQLLTHGLESQLVIWLIWLWVNNISQPKTRGLITLGILSGCATLIRPAFLVLVLLFALSYAWVHRHSTKRAATLSLLVLLLALLPILPVTAHNYKHSGHFQLISANGPVTLYLGNNRDAAGIGQYSQAFRETHRRVNRTETTYTKATISDIRANPVRWLGLMTRKTSLYFGNTEIPNNVDFHKHGTDVSPILAILPFQFGALVSLGFAGIALTFTQRRHIPKDAWMLILVLLSLCGTTVMFHVVSRFRAPAYGPLAIFSAFTIVQIAMPIITRQFRKTLFPVTLLTASSILVTTLPWIADNSIPMPTLTQPPPDAIHAGTSFGNTLELSAHSPLEPLEPGEPMSITLYWRPTNTLPIDYYGSIQIISPSGDKLTQVDQALGTGSFPQYPASKWKSNEYVSDQYLLFPPTSAPAPSLLTVLVVVYDRNTGQRLGETTLMDVPLTFRDSLQLPQDATPVNAAFGPVLLSGFKSETNAYELIITSFWDSLERTSIDGVIFIHVFDSTGNFVLGQDLRPRAGNYPMTAWQPGESIVDIRRISLKDLPSGKYSIFVGIYDPNSNMRFQVANPNGELIPDSSVHLFSAHLN